MLKTWMHLNWYDHISKNKLPRHSQHTHTHTHSQFWMSKKISQLSTKIATILCKIMLASNAAAFLFNQFNHDILFRCRFECLRLPLSFVSISQNPNWCGLNDCCNIALIFRRIFLAFAVCVLFSQLFRFDSIVCRFAYKEKNRIMSAKNAKLPDIRMLVPVLRSRRHLFHFFARIFHKIACFES